jgi:hypothetical protein
MRRVTLIVALVVLALGTGTVSAQVRTGGISYSIPWLRYAQQQADRGNPRYRFYLNPVAVTRHDLPRYGFTGASILDARQVTHAHHGEDGQPETDVVVSYRGRRYWIVLNQFIRLGPGGIWVIITITPM